MADFYLHPEKIGGDYYLAPTDAPTAGDTTAPTLTAASATATGQTTATGTVSTNEAGGTLYGTATASATATASQVQAGISKAVTAAGAQSMSFTGLPAGATLYPHYVHVDAAGNVSAVANGASFTTQSAGDTTGPVMQGELIASKTSTTTTITVPVATDASGIGEYFFAIDGGAPASNGTSRTKTYTGLAPLTPHLYEVTATDTLGNPSDNSLSITVVTDAAGEDPALVTKNIVVKLLARDLTLLANAGGINWEWSDARGVVTSSGTGLAGSASGVLTVPIRTRLLSDGEGRLILDNYNGGNILTYLSTQRWIRVP